MEHCYRELNQLDMAERCAAEARKCAMLESGGFAKPTTPVRYPKNRPQLSVIVPTYNRLPILKKCLAALAAQTLPAQNFEVIVIDDGSSDGTEEFMRHIPRRSSCSISARKTAALSQFQLSIPSSRQKSGR